MMTSRLLTGGSTRRRVCLWGIQYMLVYKMSVILLICICITSDSATIVETLRAELARAKEQARMSNAAAEKVVAELKAEQTAWRQCKERISSIERELKDATGKCESLEEDNKAKAAELDKALQEAREAWSES